MFWGFLWMAGAVTIAMPQITSQVANLLGIGRGADLVLYATALFGLFIVRHFYFHQRRLEVMITELVRREASRGVSRGPRQEKAAAVADRNAASSA